MTLILASTSPFRKQQLEELNIPFQAVPPLFNEDQFKQTTQLSNAELCLVLGHEKALSLQSQFPKAIIIGSDQILEFEGQAYNKPKTKEETFTRLQSLQGKTHKLLTSLAIISPGKHLNHLVETTLTMKSLSDSDISSYIDQDNPIGCAGAYKFEKNGHRLMSSVQTDDPSSIIGLPTKKLIQTLKDLEVQL